MTTKRKTLEAKEEKASDLVSLLQSQLSKFKGNGTLVPCPFSAQSGNPYKGNNKHILIKACHEILKTLPVSQASAPTSTADPLPNPYGTTCPFVPAFITFNYAKLSGASVIKGSKASAYINTYSSNRVTDENGRTEYKDFHQQRIPVFWIGHCQAVPNTEIMESPGFHRELFTLLDAKREQLQTKLCNITTQVYNVDENTLVGLCLKALVKGKQEGKFEPDQLIQIHSTIKAINCDGTKHGFQMGVMWPFCLYPEAENLIAQMNKTGLLPTEFVTKHVRPPAAYVNGADYYSRVMTLAAIYALLVEKDKTVESPLLDKILPLFGKTLHCKISDCHWHDKKKGKETRKKRKKAVYHSSKKCIHSKMLATLLLAMSLCHALDIMIYDLVYFEKKVFSILNQFDKEGTTSEDQLVRLIPLSLSKNGVVGWVDKDNDGGLTSTFPNPNNPIPFSHIDAMYLKAEQVVKEIYFA